MQDIWFAFDHHLGHANAIHKFKRADGTPLRDFLDVWQMNEIIVQRHNEVVKPQDKIYFGGDVAFKPQVIRDCLPRMNGTKNLIMGNHDEMDSGFYLKYFRRLMSWRHWVDKHRDCGFIATHVPMRPEAFLHRYGGRCLNVHGHMHEKHIDDPRYLNLCMENIDYRPVHFDEIMDKAAKL